MQLDLDKWNRLTDEYCERLIGLVQGCDAQVERIGGQARDKLKELRDRSSISLAFVGQYNAGKSTLISALTRRDDIAISADITTDHCTTYDWREAGLRLVDTPGLYTERRDHDQMTKQEIERSDLLAFCLTVSLFDHITLHDFKELATRDSYWPKMVLIINKLLTEPGDTDERIALYHADLEQMLGSFLLRTVPVVFVDARIYLEGIRTSNTKLVAKSRFAGVVDALNRLSRERDLLGRADSGLRIVLGGTNAAILGLAGGGPTDRAYLHLLNRYLEATATSRKTLRRRFKDAATTAARAVLEEAETLLASLDGTDPAHVDATEKRYQQNVSQRLAEIGSSLRTKILEVGSALQREVEEIQSLPLFEQFVRAMNSGHGETDERGGAAGRSSHVPRWERQTAVLQNLALGLGGLLTLPEMGSAQVPPGVASAGAGLTADSGTANASAATAAAPSAPSDHEGIAVSQLDQVITSTVDHINSAFDLDLSSDGVLHAVHATSDLLQTLAPFLALGAAAAGFWQMAEEEKRTARLGQLRLELQERFAANRDRVIRSFEQQGEAFDSAVLLPLETEVRLKRAAAESEITAEDELVKRLRQLRDDLENCLRELAKTVT